MPCCKMCIPSPNMCSTISFGQLEFIISSLSKRGNGFLSQWVIDLSRTSAFLSKFVVSICHDPQCTRACRTYFPRPWTRRVDPGSILAEQRTMPDEATKVGMWNTDTHVCVPSLLVHKLVYIYPTSTTTVNWKSSLIRQAHWSYIWVPNRL